MGLLRSHTVTLYNALPEVARVASYARTVLSGVRVETVSGVVASLRGDTAADGLTLFIPGDLAGYVEPEVYVGTAGTWTLREGDIVVVGACTMDVPSYTLAQIEATREAYRITGIETHRLLSAAVHHFEVAAS